jgi:peptide deformylase
MILPIYNCFNPVLRKKTEYITEITQDTINFINNMIETMYNADGIGLAANQVGDLRSIMIIDNTKEEDSKAKPIVMINPKITGTSELVSDYKEGCLSIPKFYEVVTRPSEIELEYVDVNGNKNKLGADELLARVIQHEIDHLNGILFFDKITPLKRALAKSKLRKIELNKVIPHYDMMSANDKIIKGIEE